MLSWFWRRYEWIGWSLAEKRSFGKMIFLGFVFIPFPFYWFSSLGEKWSLAGHKCMFSFITQMLLRAFLKKGLRKLENFPKKIQKDFLFQCCSCSTYVEILIWLFGTSMENQEIKENTKNWILSCLYYIFIILFFIFSY